MEIDGDLQVYSPATLEIKGGTSVLFTTTESGSIRVYDGATLNVHDNGQPGEADNPTLTTWANASQGLWASFYADAVVTISDATFSMLAGECAIYDGADGMMLQDSTLRSAPTQGPILLCVSGGDTLVQGNSFVGSSAQWGGSLIYLSGWNATVQGNTIDGDTSKWAIESRSDGPQQILDNTIGPAVRGGIYAENYWGGSPLLTIGGNDILGTDSEAGISTEGDLLLRITDNSIASSADDGIRIQSWSGDWDEDLLQGNSLSFAQGDGVSISSEQWHGQIVGNVIVSHVESGISLPGFSRNESVIADNIVRGGQNGIRGAVGSPDLLRVEGNDIAFSDSGIYLWEGQNLLILNNSLSTVRRGIYLEYVTDVTVSGNDVGLVLQSGIEVWDVLGDIVDNSVRMSDRGISVGQLTGRLDQNEVRQSNEGIIVSDSILTLRSNVLTDNSFGIELSEGAILDIRDGTYINNEYGGIIGSSEGLSFLTVEGGLIATDSDLELHNDIDINGSATLVDSSLLISPVADYGGAIEIHSAGTLSLSQGSLGSYSGYHISVTVDAGAGLHLQDVTLVGIGYSSGLGRSAEGGIALFSSDLTLEGISVEDSLGGLVFSGVSDVVVEVPWFDEDIEPQIVAQDGSSIIVRGGSLDPALVEVHDTSTVIREFFVTVETYDDVWDPLAGVEVTISDATGPLATQTTDANGSILITSSGFTIDSSGAHLQQTSVITARSSYLDATQSDQAVLDQDRSFAFDFGQAPIVREGAPSALFVPEGGENTLDLDLVFVDNDELSYDWSSLTQAEDGEGSVGVWFGGSTATFGDWSDFDGVEDIQVQAIDTHGLVTNHTVRVTIDAVNDRPTLEGVGPFTIEEDEAFFLDLGALTQDPDDEVMELTFAASDPALVLLGGGASSVRFSRPGHFVLTVTVTDPDGLSDSTDIDFTVTPVNDPPAFLPAPIMAINESEAYVLDLALYLSDEDSPLEALVVSTSNPHVTVLRGLEYVVEFPDGITWETVIFVATDGSATGTGRFSFNVTAINSPPAFSPIPVQAAVEDSPTVLDLGAFVSDPDGPLDVSLTADKGQVAGLLFSAEFSEGGIHSVTISATDGLDFSSTVVVFDVAEVNDPTVLTDPKGSIKAESGAGIFTVTVTDPDSPDPQVWVVIDGDRFAMERVSGTTASGAQFRASVRLGPGSHAWFFEAEDGSGTEQGHATVAGGTASVAAPMAMESWIAVVLLAIVGITALVLVLGGRRGGSAKQMGLSPPARASARPLPSSSPRSSVPVIDEEDEDEVESEEVLYPSSDAASEAEATESDSKTPKQEDATPVGAVDVSDLEGESSGLGSKASSAEASAGEVDVDTSPKGKGKTRRRKQA